MSYGLWGQGNASFFQGGKLQEESSAPHGEDAARGALASRTSVWTGCPVEATVAGFFSFPPSVHPAVCASGNAAPAGAGWEAALPLLKGNFVPESAWLLADPLGHAGLFGTGRALGTGRVNQSPGIEHFRPGLRWCSHPATGELLLENQPKVPARTRGPPSELP